MAKEMGMGMGMGLRMAIELAIFLSPRLIHDSSKDLARTQVEVVRVLFAGDSLWVPG